MARQLFLLSEAAIEKIEKILQQLVEETQACYAQVIDRSGYLIVSHGQPAHVHPEELGVIAAGILSAMQVVVNLAESQEATVKFHSRSMTDFHLVWIDARIFLLVAFNDKASEAIVRSQAIRAARNIHPHLSQDQTQPTEMDSVRFIEDKISELFQDV